MFSQLFSRRPAPSARSSVRSTRRLGIENLEGRQLLATAALPALDFAMAPVNTPQPAAAVSAPVLSAPRAAAVSASSLGQSMADFLQNKLGTRVGGGECAHIATEALRHAGADFTRTEPSGTTDYVWTSNRVARFTNGSQVSGTRYKVGDILQFENATFSSGNVSKLKHHTQVVASVDSNGRITKVFEQNIGGDRTVQKNSPKDLTKLNGGSVSVYRPVERTNVAGRYEFTIVNNTNSSRTYTMHYGSSSSSKTLEKANTAGSYSTRTLTYSGSSTPTLKIGNSSVTLRHGAAYELYMSNGQVAIRRM